MLVGAALALSGLLVQGLFQNPLADTSILGTTAGAALGGQLALLFTQFVLANSALYAVAAETLLPLGCLLGAFAALAVLLFFLQRDGDLLSVLLTGFILCSLFISLGSLATSVAQEHWELGRALIAFTLGGLNGIGPRHVALALPLVVAGVIAAWLWARSLDVLLCGEEEAASLGVDVPNVRRYAVLWISVLAGAAVAVGGNIGFVGLLVPHALRPLLGAEHRILIPATVIGGAVFLASCDLLVRLLPTRGELPLGVVTGILGAPFFLLLLNKARRIERDV
jgi:iron complex transport system permease protein